MDTVERRTGKRILAGSLIIIAGILLLLANMGFFDSRLSNMLLSWPSILIFFGLFIMFSSNFKSGFFLVGIGVLFLVSWYFFLDFWTLWPAILIIIGISALLNARRSPEEEYYRRCRRDSQRQWKDAVREETKAYYSPQETKSDESKSDEKQEGNPNESKRDDQNDWYPYSKWDSHRHHWKSHHNWDAHHHWKREEVSADFIDESAVFRGIRKLISSSGFKGGKITAVFGGIELDFAGSKLAPGNNFIDIDTIFGGVTLFIPNDWKIIIDISPVFGGISDERRRSSIQNNTGEGVLIIRGTIVFGGVEIKSA